MARAYNKNEYVEINTQEIEDTVMLNGGSAGFHRYFMDTGYQFKNKEKHNIGIKYFSIISDNSSLTTEISANKRSNPVTTTFRTAGLTTLGGFNRVSFPTPDGVGYTVYVTSSSNNDAPAGTGARKVYVDYIDANWDEQATEVTLNGQTAVAMTPTDIIRINRAQVSDVGSSQENEGVIFFSIVNDSIAGVPQTSIINAIDASYSYSAVAIRTVPRNSRMYFDRGSYYSAANSNNYMNYFQFSTFAWNQATPNTNRITWKVGGLTVNRSVAFETATSAPEYGTTDVEFCCASQTGTIESNVFWNVHQVKDLEHLS